MIFHIKAFDWEDSSGKIVKTKENQNQPTNQQQKPTLLSQLCKRLRQGDGKFSACLGYSLVRFSLKIKKLKKKKFGELDVAQF